MIDEPPLLTIARRIERPDWDLVQRFAGVPMSFICDAMGGRGALDWRIKPIAMTSVLGVALTCQCGPADVLPLQAAVAQSGPGDVIVAANGGYTGAAVVGDLLLGIAKNRGVVGFVTDGLIRDRAEIEALGLPVYGAGVCPNSPHSRGPGTVGLPVVCGGRTVSSGDVVVGDGDGVVAVPRSQIALVLDSLEKVKAAEAKMLDRVRAGLREVEAVAALLAGDRVRRCD
ncbi:MAG: RraA family protein [Roseiarcus sp.]